MLSPALMRKSREIRRVHMVPRMPWPPEFVRHDTPIGRDAERRVAEISQRGTTENRLPLFRGVARHWALMTLPNAWWSTGTGKGRCRRNSLEMLKPMSRTVRKNRSQW